MSEPDAPTGEIHRPVSGAFERTWELELLISGAVTFALLQLPGAVDRWYFSTEAMVAGNSRFLLLGAYEYAKFILYALIPSFIVHLAARAYWVGLIGLDTVFPHGVRWEKLSRNPINLAVQRERQPSIEGLIRRTDRFCSIIFSFAFSIAFVFLVSIVGMAVLWLVAFGLSAALFGGERFGDVFFAVLLALSAPMVAASILDALVGRRLDPARGVGRAAFLVKRLNYVVSMGIAYRPTINVLASNLRKVTFYPMFYGALVLLMALFIVKDLLLPSGALVVTGYEFLPDRADAHTLSAGHYADQREVGRGWRRAVPFIQSEAVRGPYVRLFLPYTRRHNEAIRRECPSLPALGGTGPRLVRADGPDATDAQVGALFDCLRRIQPVLLDGRRLELPYRLATDPLFDVKGVVAFIPADSLAAGEHLIRVPAVPREGEAAPRDTSHIPFWMIR